MANITIAARRKARRLNSRETARDILDRVLGVERPAAAFPILGAFR
jgi:hypothetical protein